MMRCEVLMIVLIPHIEMKGPSSFLLDKKNRLHLWDTRLATTNAEQEDRVRVGWVDWNYYF